MISTTTRKQKISEMAFNLYKGDKINHIKGLQFQTEPIDIRVIDEYPYYYLIEIKFREKARGALSTGYNTAINKQMILSNSVIIKKASGDIVRMLPPL